MGEEHDVVEGEVVGESTMTAIVPHQGPVGNGLTRLAAPVDQIMEAYQQYRQLQTQLLDDDDFQKIGNKKFPKKSAWRKLAVAFNVSFEKRDRYIERDDVSGRIVRAEFTFRAIAPSGRFADAEGACSVYERCCEERSRRTQQSHRHCPAAQGEYCPGFQHFTHSEHDIPATAETRAKNRAAADLFGMGEVSAEEVVGEADGGGEAQPRQRRQTKSEPVRERPEDAAQAAEGGASQQQMRAIFAVARRLDMAEDAIRKRAGVTSMKELTPDQASALLKDLQQNGASPEETNEGAASAGKPDTEAAAGESTTPAAAEQSADEPAPADEADGGGDAGEVEVPAAAANEEPLDADPPAPTGLDGPATDQQWAAAARLFGKEADVLAILKKLDRDKTNTTKRELARLIEKKAAGEI